MKVLLHICCGVCAGSVIERLVAEGHDITGYFYNPNISPPDEYERRLEVARIVASRFNIPLVAGEYNNEEWLGAINGLEREPEGGKRCEVCFRFRLQGVASYATGETFVAIATTLTVSPHKPAAVVNRVGIEVTGDRFLARDFKKQDGFKRATEIARQLNIYRQHYCGCLYSQH